MVGFGGAAPTGSGHLLFRLTEAVERSEFWMSVTPTENPTFTVGKLPKTPPPGRHPPASGRSILGLKIASKWHQNSSCCQHRFFFPFGAILEAQMEPKSSKNLPGHRNLAVGLTGRGNQAVTKREPRRVSDQVGRSFYVKCFRKDEFFNLSSLLHVIFICIIYVKVLAQQTF